MTEPQILAILCRERRVLSGRMLAAALAHGLAVGLAPLLLIALLDRLIGLRESGALLVAAAFGFLAAVYVLVRAVQTIRQLPSEQELALLLERNCPELMDSLACLREAAEHPERRSLLHDVLVARVAEILTQLDLREAVLQDAEPTRKLVAVYAAALLLLVGLSQQPLLAKASWHARTLLSEDAAGLLISPGNTEVANGGTVQILADIKRGEREATVRIENRSGTHMYPMYEGEGGKLVYDVYAVDQPFSYSVATPTLRSPTYRVSTYERARIKDALVRIQPPAYTGREVVETRDLENLQAPVGSLLAVQFVCTVATDLSLIDEGGSIDVGRASVEHRHSQKVERNLAYEIWLVDPEGRREHTDMLRVEALPDLPPAVHIVTPEDDAHVQEDSEITYAVQAVDDYGISRTEIHYAINDEDFQTQIVYAAKNKEVLERTRTDSVIFELEGLVVEGDVISYYAVAYDNAEPSAQKAETDVRFIEVRPAESEALSSDMQGMSGQQETLNVTDLIIEQKHLIRSTWSVLRRWDLAALRGELERVTREAEQLHTASSKRWQDLQERAGAGAGGEIGRLFDAALDSMESAAVALESELPKESMRFQQDALAKLVQIEIELKKNAMKMQGQGGGQGDPPKKPPEQQQQANEQGTPDQKSEQARQKKLAALREMLERLELLIQRQENVVAEIAVARTKAIRDSERDYLYVTQHGIQQDGERLRAELRQHEDAFGVAGEVQNASTNMDQVKRRVRAKTIGAAHPHAERAHHFLDRAYELLAQLIDAYEADELTKAQRKLDQLAEKQAQLQQDTEQAAKEAEQQKLQQQQAQDRGSQSSGGAPQPGSSQGSSGGQPGATPPQSAGQPGNATPGNEPGEGDASRLTRDDQQELSRDQPGQSDADLQARQEQLRTELNQFMASLGAMAGNYESSNPALAAGISKAAAEARKQRVEASMKRAANALRYRKKERAAAFQKDALQGLGQLADGLKQAAELGNAASPEELTKMLKDVLEHMAETQKGGDNPGSGEGQDAAGEEGSGEQGQSARSQGQGQGEGEGEGEGSQAASTQDSNKGGAQMGGGGIGASGSTNREAGSLRERIAQSLASMSDALQDEEMAGLAAAIAQLGDDGDPRLLGFLHRAAQILEERLSDAVTENRLELTRLPGNRAPDAYRKLVNQYFKQLSERATRGRE